jgi:SAM-dependent methyltransferase
LLANSKDIRGHVLEIGDDHYTRKFGGANVAQSDVLHVTTGNPKATIVADLTMDDVIPSGTFDCIIFTQTLQMIYDLRAALRTVYRILKPGAVLLATTHGISKIHRHENRDPWGEYWHFTTQSAHRVFAEIFGKNNIYVSAKGNVLSAIAFLHGLAADELGAQELEYVDPNYELLITIRAVK